MIHCEKCGARLQLRKYGKQHKYNTTTGGKIWRAKVVCPRRRHLLDGHHEAKSHYERGGLKKELWFPIGDFDE